MFSVEGENINKHASFFLNPSKVGDNEMYRPTPSGIGN